MSKVVKIMYPIALISSCIKAQRLFPSLYLCGSLTANFLSFKIVKTVHTGDDMFPSLDQAVLLVPAAPIFQECDKMCSFFVYWNILTQPRGYYDSSQFL